MVHLLMQTSFLHFCYSDDFFSRFRKHEKSTYHMTFRHITHRYPAEMHPFPTEMHSYDMSHIPLRCAKILNLYTLSSIIAVFIPDKRQNMFHELRNWRNHCLHSLLKVPISKIFFKSYISFFVHKVRRLRVSRLPFLEILAI